MDRGTQASLSQTTRFPGKVPYPDGHDSNQPFLCGFVWVYQIGTTQNLDQVEQFCAQNITLFAGAACRLRYYAGSQSCPFG